MRVVVCGGGVIGASIAYFLSCRRAVPIVVESTGVACAASGKSGGFLALDWCDGTPLEQLARRSFELHGRLAAELDDDWGYRRMLTYAGSAATEGRTRRRPEFSISPWLADSVTLDRRLGSTDTTAQVHPAQFTRALMQAAQAQGAEFRQGRVTGLLRTGTTVTGVETSDGRIDADAVVIAMGPWSMLAAAWLPLPAVFGLKGHSLVFDTGSSVPAEALFLETADFVSALSPELFPRPDGTTYVCAISSESPLPIDPNEVAPDPGAIERLELLCSRLSPVLGNAKILARQACFRPVTQDGLPLIGKVGGLEGAYVATGHSVWGILNAPATGEAMADLIIDGAARSVDLLPFDPTRLRPSDLRRLNTNA